MKRILYFIIIFVKTIAQKIGIALYSYKDGYHYVPEIYGSKHEKLTDIRNLDGFSAIAKTIIKDGNTYLGYDRLYTLWQAVSQAPKASIAELGVYKGGSAKFLAHARNHFLTDNLPIYLFDTFSHFPDVIKEIDITDRSAPHPISFDQVKYYLSHEKNLIIQKGTFPDTARTLNDEKFGLVHIDSDTYSSYKEGLDFFSRRLVNRGIIILDDYGFTTCPGAKRATDEFLSQPDQKNNWNFFHLLTGQAILIRMT